MSFATKRQRIVCARIMNESIRLALVLLSFLLTSCAPYIGYRHVSNPTVDHDAIDTLCAGNEFRTVVEIKTGVCHVFYNGDTAFEVQVDYFPLDTR
jgi:hypothetical protein